MSESLTIGVVVVALAAVLVFTAMARKAHPYEYISSVMLGEGGMMFVVNSLLPPGLPRIGSSLFFCAAILVSGFQMLELRRDYLRLHRPGTTGER